jgi:hypothetical protein
VFAPRDTFVELDWKIRVSYGIVSAASNSAFDTRCLTDMGFANVRLATSAATFYEVRVVRPRRLVSRVGHKAEATPSVRLVDVLEVVGMAYCLQSPRRATAPKSKSLGNLPEKPVFFHQRGCPKRPANDPQTTREVSRTIFHYPFF